MMLKATDSYLYSKVWTYPLAIHIHGDLSIVGHLPASAQFQPEMSPELYNVSHACGSRAWVEG